MVKRKAKAQNSHSESEDAVEFLPEEDSDNSEYEETKPTKRRRTSTTTRRASKKSVPNDIEDTSSPSERAEMLQSHSKSMHVVTCSHDISVALLNWFTGVSSNRMMPWRKMYDPSLSATERSHRAYEVWVSEIMLQQTRVATVIPYYNAWMHKFPTIEALASSTIDEVNAAWKGLGYYSRAKRLLTGSQKVLNEYNGLFPDNAKDMEKNIPGIGRYTAGAISSIAYGERVPVLDGNVHRFLSRFLALRASPKAKSTLDVLWKAAETIVKGTEQPNGDSEEQMHPGDVNQALIELGSTVCKDRDPECNKCPVRPWCKAVQQSEKSISTQNTLVDIEDLCAICEPLPSPHDVSAYPMKVEKKKPREELDLVSVVEWRRNPTSVEDRQFLLVKRPEGGLLAGLMEFPTVPDIKDAHEISDLELGHKGRSQIEDFFGKGVYEVKLIERSPKDVVHVFSHIRKTYLVQWVLLTGGERPPPVTLAKAQGHSPAKHKRKGTRESSQQKSPHFAESLVETSWTTIDEVINANIGTGVSKIWFAVQKLWK